MHPFSEKFDDSPSCGRSMAEIAEASDAQWESNQVLEFNESDIRDCHQRRGATPQIVLQDADKNMVK